MAEYKYHIVTMFAEERLADNPPAVREDARGIVGGTMQALALQCNMSETTCLLTSDGSTARVRIFAPRTKCLSPDTLPWVQPS